MSRTRGGCDGGLSGWRDGWRRRGCIGWCSGRIGWRRDRHIGWRHGRCSRCHGGGDGWRACWRLSGRVRRGTKETDIRNAHTELRAIATEVTKTGTLAARRHAAEIHQTQVKHATSKTGATRLCKIDTGRGLETTRGGRWCRCACRLPGRLVGRRDSG